MKTSAIFVTRPSSRAICFHTNQVAVLPMFIVFYTQQSEADSNKSTSILASYILLTEFCCRYFTVIKIPAIITPLKQLAMCFDGDLCMDYETQCGIINKGISWIIKASQVGRVQLGSTYIKSM